MGHISVRRLALGVNLVCSRHFGSFIWPGIWYYVVDHERRYPRRLCNLQFLAYFGGPVIGLHGSQERIVGFSRLTNGLTCVR